MKELRGETIYLRPLQEEDVNETYLSWLLDKEVMSGIATSGYTMDNLRQYVVEKSSNPDIAFFAICTNADNLHIGNIKLDFFDSRANVSELGILIGDKAYWGKGVGYDACKLVMEYGFGTMKLRKIYLAVYGNNPRGIRLYEKLGFKTEGVLRKHVCVDGHYYDKYLMGIFKEEFEL